MKSVPLTIWRDEEEINVVVDVLDYHPGRIDPREGCYTDDPPEIEMADYGETFDGKKFQLAPEEIDRAESLVE